jgi:ferredoxin-NADP reductase
MITLIFVKKQHEIGEVWSYFFKPTNLPSWQAGQYLNLTMPNVAPVFADRILTIASAPHEPLLQFTTLLTPSPFKQKLDSLHPGDEVEADQLGGDFTYNLPGVTLSSSQNLANLKRLFIAGGIGVTPYISIIRDKLNKKEPLNATLLYAGKDQRRPFIKELHRAVKIDPTFNIKEYSATRLTLEQLQKDIPNITEYVMYLAGSQKFSEDLGEGLVVTGLPRTQIKYDYFDGYIDIEYS